MEIRAIAVVFYEEGIRNAKEIGELYSISERTVRRWAQHHREDPENGLKSKKTRPKRSRRAIPVSLEQRIIRLKGKYPAWEARRIKHQFNLPCSWRTVHRILMKMDCSSESKQNHNPPENGSSVNMLTACGRVIPFRSELKHRSMVSNSSSAGRITLAAPGKLNDITRLSTGNSSPSRNSGHSVISEVNSGTSITYTTTGANRRSWIG